MTTEDAEKVGVSKDKLTILTAIEGIVRIGWEARKEPVLLSYIGSELKKSELDYRSVSPNGQLKLLISEASHLFTVISHPKMPLKIGALPSGAEFSYSAEVSSSNNEDLHPVDDISDKLKRSRGALYTFVRELAKMPKEEANSVIIPTSVLIRFLEGK
jgi:hypothetical protein